MAYETLNQDEIKIEIAMAIISREKELFSYQFNIDNYTNMLTSLPDDDWPTNIEMYRGVPTESLPDSMPIETVELINDYNYRDRLRYLIRTETIEKNKSQRILDALKLQITSEELATLVTHIKGV
jgi:hypothetical protein